MLDGTSTDDLLALPLGRFCNRVMAWLQARMTRQAYEAFAYRANMPPPHAIADSAEWSDEATMAQFLDFKEPV